MNRSLLLEKDVLGSGSTSRSQAILRMHYSNPETALMAWESLKVFRNFEEITGASSGFTETGYLLAVPEHYRKPMLENLRMQQQLGIDVDEVDFKFVQDLGLNANPDKGSQQYASPSSGYALRPRSCTNLKSTSSTSMPSCCCILKFSNIGLR
jgi:sarcosine oxidase subunit beta